MLKKRLKKHSSRGLYVYVRKEDMDMENLKVGQKVFLLSEKEYKNLIITKNHNFKKDCNLLTCSGNVRGKCNSDKECPITKSK